MHLSIQRFSPLKSLPLHSMNPSAVSLSSKNPPTLQLLISTEVTRRDRLQHVHGDFDFQFPIISIILSNIKSNIPNSFSFPSLDFAITSIVHFHLFSPPTALSPHLTPGATFSLRLQLPTCRTALKYRATTHL